MLVSPVVGFAIVESFYSFGGLDPLRYFIDVVCWLDSPFFSCLRLLT